MVANEQRNLPEVQELMAWLEVTVLNLISPQTLRQMDWMVLTSALINIHFKEDYYWNSKNNIQPYERCLKI